MTEQRWLRVPEAAQYANVSRDTIYTACERGELRHARVGGRRSIRLRADWITLRGETTKSKKTRLVPISTQRLRAVLEWLRLDAAGEEKSGDTRVFTNEAGGPLPLFHHSWQAAVLKAHGVRPKWSTRLNYKGLSKDCKAVFRNINLRWHDLRHEYASRLVEKGVPLAQVRDLLGHASITTTERYDNQKLENLQVAVTKLARGVAFDVPAAPLPRPASFKNLSRSRLNQRRQTTRMMTREMR